jgi:hypothetical protein
MGERRRGFGRSSNDKPGEQEVDDVARTDRLIDALAAGRPADPENPNDRALADLLEGWRDELRSPPTDGVASEAAAAAALREGPGWRRHTHRVVTIIGSAAAVVLTLGGFGVVVASSEPGEALYSLRTALFGEPKSVVDDRIVLTAKTELEKVQQMIARGQWDEAQQRLTSLGGTVQTVNDTHRRQDLLDQWNRLNIQVQKRDRNAVPPPGR